MTEYLSAAYFFAARYLRSKLPRVETRFRGVSGVRLYLP